MQYSVVSADNHIDLTYCPPDLWSSQAPAKWKLLVPRTEELSDGLHWFVEAQDKGVWNGIGPGFLRYEKGLYQRTDRMLELGFEWNHRPGTRPRPTTPELRLADLDRDGQDAEIVYGCLMLNDLMTDGSLRAWVDAVYNDWAADFAKRADPRRIFPLAILPNHDPLEAAAEVRRCARLGLRGGDLAFKRMSRPLYHRDWDPLWRAAAECSFPISFHSTGFKALRAPDTPSMASEYATEWRWLGRTMFQLDGMEVLASLIVSGACERHSELRFVLGEAGVTWIPHILDRLDAEYEVVARGLGFRLKPSDYFRRQGYTTYQEDQYLEPVLSIVGEDNIMWGADYPHPAGVWGESQERLGRDLAGLPERARRKIVCDNVVTLYGL
jgi:uncharacterized protein